MLNITILATGKLKERHFSEACGEYAKRISAYANLQIIEIPECRLPREPSPAQILQGLGREGDIFLSKIPSRAFVIALCVEGGALSSTELAACLEKASGTASHIIFIIGGSHGLDERVKSAANLRLSMSEMTFPHQLARVMLLEQIYRACTINTGNAGGKYHK